MASDTQGANGIASDRDDCLLGAAQSVPEPPDHPMFTMMVFLCSNGGI